MFDISSAEFFSNINLLHLSWLWCVFLLKSMIQMKSGIFYISNSTMFISSAHRFNASSTMKCPFNSSTRFSWGFGKHPACESQVTQLICSDVLYHDAAQITLHHKGGGVFTVSSEVMSPAVMPNCPSSRMLFYCPISQQSESYPRSGSTRTSPNIPQDEVSYREETDPTQPSRKGKEPSQISSGPGIIKNMFLHPVVVFISGFR